ncbi:hypothetical protein J3A83DRAFT_2166040 [Scleroderma citrinum]
MDGSSRHAMHVEFNSDGLVGREGSPLPLSSPVFAMPLFHLHEECPFLEVSEFVPYGYSPHYNPFDTHVVPNLYNAAQEQGSNSVSDHHHDSLLLYTADAPPKNEIPFQAVQECHLQQYFTVSLPSSTDIDPLPGVRPSSTDTQSPDITFSSPLLLLQSRTSLVRASRRRQPRDNSRRKEKVVCGVDGCFRVLSRDSWTRHKKEIHLGQKRRNKKSRTDVIYYIKRSVAPFRSLNHLCY